MLNATPICHHCGNTCPETAQLHRLIEKFQADNDRLQQLVTETIYVMVQLRKLLRR